LGDEVDKKVGRVEFADNKRESIISGRNDFQALIERILEWEGNFGGQFAVRFAEKEELIPGKHQNIVESKREVKDRGSAKIEGFREIHFISESNRFIPAAFRALNIKIEDRARVPEGGVN